MASLQLFPDLLDHDHELHTPKRRRLLDLPPPSSTSPPPPLSLPHRQRSVLPNPSLPRFVPRKLRMLFEKKLSDSDASRGQDRLLLGKRSQGCLGMGNSPSAPDWRDVVLVFHDEEEPGKTWQMLHGLWPSTKAFVLKGREWSKYRDYKRLQAKDILTISIDEADGSLWISHSPTAPPPPPPPQVVQQPPQQRQQDLHFSSRSPPKGLILFPLSPGLQSRSPLTPSTAAPTTIPLESVAFLDLKLGLPASSVSTDDSPPRKRQRLISASSTLPSPPTSISTTSERSSTCTISRSTSEDRSSGNSSPPDIQVDQGMTSDFLTLGRGSLSDCRDLNAARGERPKGRPTGRNLRVLFVKLLMDEDVSPGQETLLLQGKWSHGCLGRANTPELIMHDMEEVGKTWQFFHGFQESSRAYVLKGEQWNQFRAHKRLQPKDALLIFANDADGTLWISHRRCSQR